CQFIRKQQRPDGSLNWSDAAEGSPAAVVDPDGGNHYPGQALYGLLLSLRHRPAAWKFEVARKTFSHDRTWWRRQPNPDFAGWHLAACALAWEQTHDPAVAEFAYEMGDWMCALQYAQLDPR